MKGWRTRFLLPELWDKTIQFRVSVIITPVLTGGLCADLVALHHIPTSLIIPVALVIPST
jgi:hypothetical protein